MTRTAADAAITRPSSFLLTLISLFLLSTLLTHNIVLAADTKSISLFFLDDDGGIIGEAQTIANATCTPLDQTQLLDTEGYYASVTTSDLRSALNLYRDTSCQVFVGSTVGEWDNTDPVTDVMAIRWEGTADANFTTGEVRPDPFPKEQQQQQVQTGGTDSDTVAILDPSKGKWLVGIVAAVLAIGIIIGAYQVYEASLYEAPPKEPKKEKKSKGLNVKKVKKKDAFFKKPVQGDEQQPLNPTPPQQQGMGSRRIRSNQLSETGQSRGSSGNDNAHGPGTVMIEIWDTNMTKTSRPIDDDSTRDLTQTGGGNGGGNYSNSSRGGEVAVPIHSFDNKY
ncbi:hypothetical protein BGX21_004252 [Mortierella sp. AD011]|nr:hypothetical protein BGX20_009607 [Mortierella sp. AD010]KAF9374071.1 hypothetical protein BGX21_004252 [Mortierella sp. AD011]